MADREFSARDTFLWFISFFTYQDARIVIADALSGRALDTAKNLQVTTRI